MSTSKSSERKEKLKRFSHILAGIIILLHAYEKYDSGHGSYIYFAIAGVIFLSIALFHHRLKRSFPWIDSCFFIIESLLSLIIAYEYFEMGKVGLPIIYLIAGLLQLTAVYIFSKRLKKDNTSS